MSDGLSELSLPVPFLRLDEKAPTKSGPVGRIDRVLNYIVNKFKTIDGTYIQLDKRPGWHSMSTTTYDPYDLGASTGSLPEAACAGKLGNTNFIVGTDGMPYVYSPAAGKWAKFYKETILANKIAQSLVKMDTSVIKCPDSASCPTINGGYSHCYVWQDSATGFPWIMVLDENDGMVRAPAAIASGNPGRVKVRSDGSQFWTVYDDGPSVHVNAIDPATGSLIGGIVISLDSATNPWDIVCDSTVSSGIFIVRGTLASVNSIKIARVTRSGSTVSLASDHAGNATSSDPSPVNGIAFLEPALDGKLYVARTNDLGSTRETLVYQCDAVADIFHTFHTNHVNDNLINLVNVTGFVKSGRVYTALSILPDTGGSPPVPGQMINCATAFGYGTLSADYQGQTVRRSVGLASRQFYVGEIPCVFAYYTSVETVVSEISGSVTQGTPTFFVLRADDGTVIGRILPGQAAGNAVWQDWNGTSLSPDAFELPSARTNSSSVLVALPVTGEQNVTRVRHNDGPFADAFSSSVGIRNIEFNILSSGSCVECENETLIPGALPRSFDGVTFGAAGAELAPEQPNVVTHGTGPFQSGDKRSYVLVWERFNRSGNKMRSPSSVSFQWTGAGASSGAQLTIPSLRATSYDDWICSIYRTTFAGGQEGLTHYKITSDQSPLKNDPNSDTIIFIDTVDDDTARLNEILYGGSGAVPTALGGGDGQQVDHECAPAFNTGTVFGDRAFLVGYDGNVWFSLPGSAGNSLAFSSLFKMSIPTQDSLTAIDSIDSRLIVFCERSVWFNNQDNYLDATGAGDVPTPVQLPITNGCVDGLEWPYRDGILYASSAGGVYLLTRDLDSQYIGGAVEDDVNAGSPIRDILGDDSQRIFVLLDNGTLAVYDIVSQSWYIWDLASADGSRLTTVNGKISACCSDGKVRSLGSAYDDDGEPILSSVGIADVSVAGVPGCQMIWQVVLIGINYSEHTLTVDYTPDGLTDEVEVFGPLDPADFGVASGEDYRAWIEPARMETSSFRVDISDALTVPGRGLSLQMLGLSVGIIPGTRRQSLGRTGSPQS